MNSDKAPNSMVNFPSDAMDLLRRAALGGLSIEDEHKLEALLVEQPQAIAVLEELSASNEQVSLLRSLSDPKTVQPQLAQAIRRLTTHGLNANSDSVHDAEGEVPIPDLASENITIIRKLGQGGMGVVYEGYDKNLDRPVAIKMIAGRFRRDDRARQMLLQEAQAAAQLHHENVVSIYSIHLDCAQPYLVQQLVRGQSLGQRIERTGPLDAKALLDLTTQLARGLAAAHRLGMVHRDLKPDNILIEEQTQVAHIADFGIAFRQPPDQPPGQPPGESAERKCVQGTPAYMSPEQTKGLELDGRSDLFSLGSVLYAAATGDPPFQGADASEVMENILSRKVASLNNQRSDVPRWWCEMVHRLVSKTPSQRFASAQVLLEELERKRGSPPARLRLVALIGVSIASTVALAWMTWRREESRSRALPASREVGPSIADTDQVKESPWFEVEGNTKRFASLEEAIAQAEAHALLRFHGSGEVACDPIVLQDKPLTWEMGNDSKVVLRPRNHEEARTFIRTNSSLRLVNIHIDSDRRGERQLPVSSTIQSINGRLLLENCSIREQSFIACLSVLGGEAELKDCQLTAVDGLAIAVPHTGSHVFVNHCAIESLNLAMILSGGGISDLNAPATKLALDRSTLLCKTVLRIMIARPPTVPVSFSMNKTLDLSENEVMLSSRFSRLESRANSPVVLNALKATVVWRETHCVHRNSAQFLSTIVLLPNSKVNYEPLSTWDEWAKLWSLPSRTSHFLASPIEAADSGWQFDPSILPAEFQDCGFKRLHAVSVPNESVKIERSPTEK